MLEKKTLTTGEIAKFCGVHFRTVIRWIERGQLKAYQLPGRGDNRVTLSDFLYFLNKQNMPIPEELKPKTSNQRVLIADDDLQMAKSIQRVLKRKGFETSIAINGFEAGIMLGTFSPSVLTLDLKMPAASGFDVIKLIRETKHLSAIKILVVSATSQKELKKAKEAGADDVLEKPFKNEVLVEKVMKLAGVKE